ncbi:MAG: DUF4430 domain-containing protein [Patescibacteria group bacterium]
MTKKLRLILLFLLLVIGFTLFSFLRNKSQTENLQSYPAEVPQSQTTLVIDYGDGKRESSSFVPRQGQTVFDALKEIAQQKGIVLDTKQYDFGIFVKAIGGYESSNEKAWIYFVNGASGTVAADQHQIKAGDLIEWKYTKPE